MNAVAVFPKSRQIKLIDVPEPVLTAPTEVKLRVLEVGVCGTDREICSFTYGSPPPDADHLVIGHESLAEVTEVGSAVTRVRTGDLAVLMVRRPCRHASCLACRSGRQDFCYSGDFTERGINGRDGFLTSFVVDDQAYVNVVPPELREFAVLTEPLTIAEKALSQVWRIQERLPWVAPDRPMSERGHGRRALVLGAGPVGLLGAMTLAAAGFETTVYSRTSGPHRKAELARSFGAEYLAAETHTPEQAARRVGHVDLVYEATGASQIAFQMLPHLGVNGVFVFTGVPGRKGPVELDTDLIMRDLVLQNQVVVGTVNAGRDAYEAAIRQLATFAARWPDALRRLITGRFPMRAFADLLVGPATGIKNVFTIAS